jgi:hypothetical protein
MKMKQTSMATIIAMRIAYMAKARQHIVIKSATVKQSPMVLIPASATTAQRTAEGIIGTDYPN